MKRPALGWAVAALVTVNIVMLEMRIAALSRDVVRLERQVGQVVESVITLAKASENNSNAIIANSNSIEIMARAK